MIWQMANLRRPAPFAKFYMVGREDKGTNNRTMLPILKNNAAAGYQGPVKIQLLKGSGPLENLACMGTLKNFTHTQDRVQNLVQRTLELRYQQVHSPPCYSYIPYSKSWENLYGAKCNLVEVKLKTIVAIGLLL